MKSMYLAMGYRCNHHCYFCPCGKEQNKTSAAPAEQLLAAIDAGIRENQIQYVTLSGGEPTLHPDFHKILAYCADRKLHVTVLSNGDTFYKESNVRKYFEGIEARYFTVTTAIHSHLPELHEKVTGVPGSYEHTVQGLKHLIPMGIPFTVKQVISKWNYQYLPDFVDFVYREYGPFASLTFCGMDFCGMDPEEIDQVAISYREAGPYLEKALDMVLSIRKQFGGFPMVTAADLPLCCVDPYYWGFFSKVSRGQLSKYSAPEKVSRDLVSSSNVVNDCDIYCECCKRCCVSDYCPGIWSSAYQYFGEAAAVAVMPEITSESSLLSEDESERR